MVRYGEKSCKSILTKSLLPNSDYVINPYAGCAHGCCFCYARFMSRFSGHIGEEWGSYVDVKVNACDALPKRFAKIEGKTITFGSVTDPYQAIEKRYCITRNLLNKLPKSGSTIFIITRSPLITRDIDLLRQFHDLRVCISLSYHDDAKRRIFEPHSTSIGTRIAAVRQLHQAGIHVVLFISPIFPGITDWRKIVAEMRPYIAEFWFESLNMLPAIRSNVLNCVGKIEPKLLKLYLSHYNLMAWFRNEQELIKQYCHDNGVPHELYFFHKERKKADD